MKTSTKISSQKVALFKYAMITMISGKVGMTSTTSVSSDNPSSTKPADVGGREPDRSTEMHGAEESDDQRDQDGLARARDQLGEDVLSEGGRTQQVGPRDARAGRVDLGGRVVRA